ncbi:hypothetical protein [Prosthecobacter sp.]|uniref:hypothetical protein n=1 Tax=Prosthecobacter sp. TaxID=1965333 RepID=UPI0025DA9F66|nr:hypothetical protein [Prosthecobacter sp.]
MKNLVLQQAKHKEAASALEGRRAQLQSEFDKAQKEWVEWQKRSEDERNLHSTRLESLRAEEARLGPVQAAVHEAEKAHVAWIQSITALSAQHEERTAALAQITARHDEKSADLQRLAEDENSARQDLKDLATQREQTLAHLRQMREEQAHDETVLDELRRQIAELEAHSRHCKEIAEVRNDQVDAAEKKLDQLSQSRTQIQAHIQELTGTEEKLVLTLERCREAEKRQAALTTALAELDSKRQQSEEAAKELESRVAALKHSREEASAAADKAQTSRRQSEASLLNVQTDLAAREKDLATRIAELNAETKRLKETQERHAEIERQCQELAETGKKLAEEKQRLATAGQNLEEVNASIAEGKTRIASLQSSIKDLEGEEGASKGRIDVLHAREKDLRAELTRLSAAERKERVRFEEVRQLTVEAEKEHAEQKQELASSLATQGRELAELVSKLTPLRDWKEAMDLLYARLATLPQDSSEARDLWREIEREKNGLHDLITTARSQALVGSPPEPRNEPECEPQQNAPTKANRPPEPPRATTARVGIGSVQETTLRARLTHLRENVQREEAHLEHLRLERARQEIHPRSGPASDAMMREHERQLEAKIRRDEEHYTAIKHKIGLAETEEEKRREKITELEHKLAELRADISEAERLRHELRQQADLAHTELKNYEAALVRVTKKTTG